MAPATISIFDLPDELLLIITEYLRGKSLASFNQSCKNARRIANPLLDEEKADGDLKSLRLWKGRRTVLEFNSPHKQGIEIDRIIFYNKLIIASEAGDIQQVKALLATKGPSANHPITKAEWEFPFYTALEGAVHSNHFECVEALVEAGARVPRSSVTSIRLVVYGEFNENVMQFLVRHGLRIAPEFGSGPDLLSAACNHGASLPLLKWLIQQYPDLVRRQVRPNGETPFSVALRGNPNFDVQDRLAFTRELIKLGWDILGPCNERSQSALRIAAEACPGNEAVVRLLLRRMQLPEMSQFHKEIQYEKEHALHYALQKPGNGEIVRLLLRAGAGQEAFQAGQAIKADPGMGTLLYETAAKRGTRIAAHYPLALASALGYSKKVAGLLQDAKPLSPAIAPWSVGRALVTAGNDKTLDCLLSFTINAAPDAQSAIFKEAPQWVKHFRPLWTYSAWCRTLARGILRGTPETTAVLLRLLCNVVPGGDQEEFLCTVIESGNLAALEILLSRLTPPTDSEAPGWYHPLTTAVNSGHPALLEALIKWCPTSLLTPLRGNLLLGVATEQNKPELVRILLKAGFDPTKGKLDAKKGKLYDSRCITCSLLEYSVCYGFTEIVRILIDHCYAGDLHQRPHSKYERPLLWYAAGGGQLEIATMLLEEFKVDVNFRSADVAPALYMAASNGHTQMAKLLLAKGAIIDDHDYTGRHTPIRQAAYLGDKDTAQVLIDAGAWLNSPWYDLPLFTRALTERVQHLRGLLLENLAGPKIGRITHRCKGVPLTPEVFKKAVESQAATAKLLADNGALMHYKSRSKKKLSGTDSRANST